MSGREERVVFRRARPEDARAIATVHVETWRTAYRGLMSDAFLADLDTQRRERFWREETAATDDRRPWVADVNGVVVALAAAGPARDDDAPPTAGEVYLIYVLEQTAGQGLGHELLRRVEADLSARGHATALLWVLRDNAVARRFYERHGWQRDGAEKSRTFGDRELVEVRYRKPLAASSDEKR